MKQNSMFYLTCFAFCERLFSQIALLLCLSLLLLSGVQVRAQSACSGVFSGGVQSNSATGSVDIFIDAVVNGSGSSIASPTVNDFGQSSACDSGDCTATGTPANSVTVTFPSFPASDGSINVTTVTPTTTTIIAGDYGALTESVNNADVTLSSTNLDYTFTSFQLSNADAVLTLSPGDYYIAGDFKLDSTNLELKLSEPGLVRIFVGGDMTISGGNIDSSDFSGNPFFWYIEGDFNGGQGSTLNGYIYVKGDATVTNLTTINGGISAKELNMFNDTTVNYDAASLASGLGDSCVGDSALDSFSISVGGGTGSTCFPTEITISALDSSSSVLTDYVGTIALTTSTSNGDWAKTATASDALGTLLGTGGADSGSANYTFEASEADAGTITIELENTHAEALTITVEDSSEGVSSTSSLLTFSENAFVVSSTDRLGDDVIAGRSHSFQIDMYRRDPSTGICSVASGYNATAIKTWLARDPSDPGGAAPTLTNTVSATISLPDVEPGTNNLTLNFSAGSATFSLGTTDVGRYALSFLDDSNGFSTSDITGSSNTLTARPFGFHIGVTDASAVANPAATTASGNVFTTAGANFNIGVTAVAWSSAADANGDGIPDGHNDTNPTNNADLSANAALVSFGQEATAAESIVLQSSLYLPSPGTDPGLQNSTVGGNTLSSFSSGVATTSTAFFEEVGIIEISAAVQDGDYLATGTANTTNSVSLSGAVGRFVPANFTLANENIAATCGFSYMDEPFNLSLNLTAVNASGVTTTNYRDDFIKLDSSVGTLTLGVIDTAAPTLLSGIGRVNSALSRTVSWNSGVASVTKPMSVTRDTSLDGPYNVVDIGINLSDIDGITHSVDMDANNDTTDDHHQLGTTTIRYGRLRLDSAFGPETASLPVNFLLEFWNNTFWQTTTDDTSCTAIDQTDIAYVTVNAMGAETSVTIDLSKNVTVGGGTTTGSYGNESGGNIAFSNGDALQSFSAPGAGNTGTFFIDVDITNYDWLKFDWDGSGTDDDALPRAYYSFGTYRGHDRIIYWNEVLD